MSMRFETTDLQGNKRIHLSHPHNDISICGMSESDDDLIYSEPVKDIKERVVITCEDCMAVIEQVEHYWVSLTY